MKSGKLFTVGRLKHSFHCNCGVSFAASRKAIYRIGSSIFALPIVVFSLILSGCAQNTANMGSKIESTSYSEKTVAVEKPLELDLVCDYGNIEIYSWDKQEVKFEMKRRVRGAEEKTRLEERLKDFNIDVTSDGGKVVFKSEYKGNIKSSEDKMLDLRVYIPRKVKSIREKIDKGYIKFMDDMKCSLEVEAKTAHIDINRINGSIKLNVGTGNIRISSGILRDNSQIQVETGNLFIKSEYDNNAKCVYETKTGNVELYLPKDLQLGVEYLGTIDVNEFSKFKSEGDIVVKSGVGKISLKKI